VIALELCFPGGRYHATPWGHHVNEGLVEWPPSPWRLLRALMATGFTKLGWTEVPPAARTLFERLASELPTYVVPRATSAHSRHYMPQGNAAGATALVLDAWVNVSGVLGVRWPVELPDEARATLDALVVHLGYLGRAESWVDARMSPDGGASWDGHAVEPVLADEPSVRRGFEQIPLLAPTAVEVYNVWRERELAALADARAKARLAYPKDLVACLGTETAWLREHGWSQPPGSRVALYWRRSDALATVVAPERPAGKGGRVEAMLLALAVPSRNTSALPSIERALPQAEALHQAAVARAATAAPDGPQPYELYGKGPEGRPLSGHRHAHILALDLDGDAHIDHLLVWGPGGLGDAAQRALRAVRGTWAKNVDDLSLSVAGAGSLESFATLRDRLGEPLRRLIAPSRVWVSRTPFVAPRFLKTRGRNTVEGQVLAELEGRGLHAERVEILGHQAQDEAQRLGRFRHFVLTRKKGAPPPQTAAWRVRITFAEPVSGPISLGYGSHFGLGSFEAV
jgi:CRISPR-associated protein Csb2